MLAPDNTAAPALEVDSNYSLQIVATRDGEYFGRWLQVDIEAGNWATRSTANVAQAVSIDADIAKAARAFVRALEMRGGLADGIMAREVKAFLQDVKRPRRGAPKRPNMFAVFLPMLLHMICDLGGDISINRNNGTGNVINLLEFLRPLMPPGFIPNTLPLAKIERICTQVRARIRVQISAEAAAYEPNARQGRRWPTSRGRRWPKAFDITLRIDRFPHAGSPWGAQAQHVRRVSISPITCFRRRFAENFDQKSPACRACRPDFTCWRS